LKEDESRYLSSAGGILEVSAKDRDEGDDEGLCGVVGKIS
jgi:hypothetical protein